MHAMACRGIECRPVLLIACRMPRIEPIHLHPMGMARPCVRTHPRAAQRSSPALRPYTTVRSARTVWARSAPGGAVMATAHRPQARQGPHARRMPALRAGRSRGATASRAGMEPVTKTRSRVRLETRGHTHRDGDVLLLVDDAGRVAARGVPQVHASVRVHALHLPHTPSPKTIHTRAHTQPAPEPLTVPRQTGPPPAPAQHHLAAATAHRCRRAALCRREGGGGARGPRARA